MALTQRWTPHTGKSSITNLHRHLPPGARAALWSHVCPSASSSEMGGPPRELASSSKNSEHTETEHTKSYLIQNKRPSLMIYIFSPLAFLMSKYWPHAAVFATYTANTPCHVQLLSLMVTSLRWHISPNSSVTKAQRRVYSLGSEISWLTHKFSELSTSSSH